MQSLSTGFHRTLIPSSSFTHKWMCLAGMTLLAVVSQPAIAARFLSIPPTYASGGVPQQLAAADVNRDGIPDVIVSNANGVVSLLTGKAGGGFAASQTIVTITGGTPPIAVGDFNADTYPDLAVSVKSSNSVWVYLNQGNGTFGAPGKYGTSSMPGQLAVGDINPDSRLDIVVVTAVGLSALQGNGNGTFKVAVNSTGASGGTLALGDVNRDGHLDVVVIGGSPDGEFLGSGDGHFVKSSYYPPTANLESPSQVVLADVDHDGLLDLIIAGASSRAAYASGVSISWGKGDGTFTATLGLPSHSASAVVVADFNADGRTDIGIANGYADSVILNLNKSGRTFAAAASYKVGQIYLYYSVALPGAIVAGEFTGDHHTDVAVATKNGVQVVRNTGNGAMASPLAADTFFYPREIIAAPLNNDSNIDFAIVGSDDRGNPFMVTLFGDGTGRFPTSFNPFVPVWFGLMAGKFNSDAMLDLAYIDYGQSIFTLINSGNNTFVNTGPVVDYVMGGAPVAGEFNGDGISDFAVLDGTSVDIYLSHGTGVYTGPTSYGAGAGPASLLVRDINNDGKRDLLIADNQGRQIVVLLGNGDGTFQSPRFAPTLEQPSSVTVGDFNRDGKLDIAAGCEKSIEVKLGNGNGTFGGSKIYSAPNGVFALSQASLRRDGIEDLLFTDGFSLKVMMGNGDGTFNAPVTYSVGANPAWMAVGDFNNDGSADAAVVDQTSTALTILLNLGGTRITLQSSATTVKLGAPVTFTATVTATVAGTGVPTGTLAFKDGSKAIATVQLSNGKASFTTSQLSTGTHSMTASYWETAAFNPGVSAPVTQTITP